MKRRLFIDADTTPSEALLRKQLGAAMEFYLAILQVSGDYRKQWQYSRGNGWLLKVDDMRKALYYLIAFDEGIEVSLTVRDHEREELARNPSFDSLRPQLELATKYAEGYALRFEIENSSACAAVARFLTELIRMRTANAPAGVKQLPGSRTAQRSKTEPGAATPAKKTAARKR